MKAKAWRERLGEIATSPRAAAVEGPKASLEAPLVALWGLMEGAPYEVNAAYEVLSEERVGPASESRSVELERGRPAPFTPDLGAPLSQLVEQVAVEIRALDQAYFRSRSISRPDDVEEWLSADRTAWVVPRVQSMRIPPKYGQLFNRRGLLCHRLLPVDIEGLRVKLYAPSLLGPGWSGDDVDLVAAVFPRVSLVIEDNVRERTFKAKNISNMRAMASDVERQLDLLSSSDQSLCIVWPELSMPDDLKHVALDRMRRGDIDTGFAVLGSWHHDGQDRVRNIAPVVDARGQHLFDIVKRQRFQRDGSVESISPGSEIPVLSYGDVLVAFAVCKDFCDSRYPSTPYVALDVDYVMVPSFGDAATIEAHARAAEGLLTGRGARAFVVQQNLALSKGRRPVWGEVLWPAAKPRGRAERRSQRARLDRKKAQCVLD